MSIARRLNGVFLFAADDSASEKNVLSSFNVERSDSSVILGRLP